MAARGRGRVPSTLRLSPSIARRETFRPARAVPLNIEGKLAKSRTMPEELTLIPLRLSSANISRLSRRQPSFGTTVDGRQLARMTFISAYTTLSVSHSSGRRSPIPLQSTHLVDAGWTVEDLGLLILEHHVLHNLRGDVSKGSQMTKIKLSRESFISGIRFTVHNNFNIFSTVRPVSHLPLSIVIMSTASVMPCATSSAGLARDPRSSSR
jgi:hypothetical protein